MGLSKKETFEEKRVFLAATRQNDGKTVVGIGLLSALKQKLKEVGFIKPVGQKYVEIEGRKIDKDAVLAAGILDIGKECLKLMNPVAVERGFTKNYLNKRYDVTSLIKKIKEAYAHCASGKRLVVIEGTGHAGVGSVFDLNNAVVAKILKARVVLITTGGIGKPIDEIILNKALFDKEGVELAGVIVNKVMPDKIREIKKYLKKGLEKHRIPLLGVLPYTEDLSLSTMDQVREGLNLPVLSGKNFLNQTVRNRVVGAMFPKSALRYIKNDTLLITSGDREDLILTALSLIMTKKVTNPYLSGLILTGGIRPHRSIINLIRRTPIPVLISNEDTYTVASKVHDLIIKIRQDDKKKIEIARQLVERHVNINNLLARL